MSEKLSTRTREKLRLPPRKTRAVVQGDYLLSDFALAEYRDPVNSVTILAILVAFTIPLFVEAFKHYSNLNAATSYFLGGLVLIFYMFYTVDYYEKVWSRWFSLPDDFGFFRIYSLVTGVVVIAAMTVFPDFWYCYLSLLFLILSVKKYRTRWKYERAFLKEFSSFDGCGIPTQQCVFLLAQNMSRNFLLLGFVASLPICAAIIALHHFQLWSFSWSILGKTISGDYLFIGASGFYGMWLVVFWYKKVRVMLAYMVEKIEEGDVNYFLAENRNIW